MKSTKLKASNYNFFFEADDGNILAFNALSNSLARVTPVKFKQISQILEAPAQFSFDTEDKEKLKQDLLKGHFLIADALDEVEILKMRNRIGRYSKEYLGLAIAPTLACNFDCTYCFEDKKPETMTEEIENALVKFVESRLNIANVLSVTWFGGEPTLRIDTIERLTRKFQRLCKEYKVEYLPTSIITNGYRLTGENARKLKDSHVVGAQVTIDGPPKVHDKRRKLKNNKGTFYHIMDNIKESMDILRIHIRINIDKTNIDEVDDLYKIFEEYGFIDKVPFYFGNVDAMTESCADISTLCLNTREFSDTVIELLKKSKERGFGGYLYPSSTHFGFCCADRYNTYVVAPTGDLYKCWNEISFTREHSVGSIFEEDLEPAQINNLTKYLNWEPFTNEKCVKCNLLPICGGGCPYNAINNRKSENCIDFKYNLYEMLRLKYHEIKVKKNLKK